jgi:hypothetical protein
MGTRRGTLRRLRWLLATGTAVLLGILVSAAPALAKESETNLRCSVNAAQIGVVHMKSCPITPYHRPLTVSRVCCKNHTTGKFFCKPFPACPSRSPS